MQRKKSRLTVLLVVLVLAAAMGVTLITLRVKTSQAQQANDQLRQQLAQITRQISAFQPVAEDAKAYAQRYDTLVKIAGEYADASVISAGLTSTAMEDAARKAGYAFPREIIFKVMDD